MARRKPLSKGSGDTLKVKEGKHPFDVSDSAWLIGQGVRYLNGSEKEDELAYKRITELLRRCNKDVLETIIKLFNIEHMGDAALRWNLLYILGDVGDERSADFIVRVALKKLPEHKDSDGCESARDTEMLVSTMAVQALQNIAVRHPDIAEHVLKIVSKKPAKPILIEAVKAANALGLKEKVKDILKKEDHWILDIRKAQTKDLIAEPEREDDKKRKLNPPKGEKHRSPKTACCANKEE